MPRKKSKIGLETSRSSEANCTARSVKPISPLGSLRQPVGTFKRPMIFFRLSLVSNTFFPVEPSNQALWALMQLNPIYHLAECARGLMVLGDPGPHLLGLLGSSVVWLVPSTLLAVRLTRRRVLGD